MGVQTLKAETGGTSPESASRARERERGPGAARRRGARHGGRQREFGHVVRHRDRSVTGGRLDNVIANAGFSLPGNLESHAPEDMRAMVLTNVLGPALLVRETPPHLKESKGRIVITGSVAGVRNTPGNLYSVTKRAAHALAENTRLLAGKDGAGVTVVAPGWWTPRSGTGAAAPQRRRRR